MMKTSNVEEIRLKGVEIWFFTLFLPLQQNGGIYIPNLITL